MRQSLGIVPRLFSLVMSGEKTSTIRWRETHIEPGYMRYVCNADPRQTAIVWVARCTDMPLSNAAAFVGKEKEWPKEVMLEGMREHYLAIQWTDSVQVIEHLTPVETRKRPCFPG